MQQNTITAFDYECTGFDPITKKIFAFVITDSDGVSKVYRLDNSSAKKNRKSLKVLKQYFADITIEKIAHNLKFELHFTLRSIGIKIPEGTIFHDTMIMSQICDNLEKSHALDSLCNLYVKDKKMVKYWKTIDAQVSLQANARGKRYDRVDEAIMKQYQINDGFRTMLLYKLFEQRIQPYWENYRWEIALIQTTQRMEDFGLYPSQKNITEMVSWLESELYETYNKMFYLMNSYENYNSDDIVRKYLYTVKKYPVTHFTDSGEPSVEKEVFFKLLEMYPADKDDLNLIFKYRSYKKGLSMVQGYIERIHPVDGLIHHTINTNSARTGRQSAKNPNMQNVAKSNAMKIAFPVPARKCFNARPKSKLLFVDYSGIEMRLIIEAVKDPIMIQALKDGIDIHAVASEYWFGEMFTDIDVCLSEYLPHNDVLYSEHGILVNEIGEEKARLETYSKAWKILRGAGKNGQFALAYGADFGAIQRAVNIPEGLLRPGFNAYRKRFPLIASFTADSIRMAKKDGFVMTSFGRKLNIEKTRVHTASNYRIQGTAAEMLKRSTVLLDQHLQKHHQDIRLIVPIHDELMIHLPNIHMPNIKALTAKFGEVMTDFPQLAVPIEVDWEITGKTWNDKSDLSKYLKAHSH